MRKALPIVCAYLAFGIYADDPPVSRPDDGNQLALERWGSIGGCGGAGKLERGPGIARLATWNVRWFPDGTFHDERDTEHATDVDWLACEIARLNADVLAVQEFKKHPRAMEHADDLIAELDEATSGSWKVVLDDCPHENLPHVGFLYDSRRVRAGGFRSLAVLNPHSGACDQAAHPGFAGRFEFPGGLDLELVSVHAKWGFAEEDLELRRRTYHALGDAYREIVLSGGDPDVVFLGDFNTNGCPGCTPPLTATDEIGELNRVVGDIALPFHVLGADAACTEYEDGAAWLLDHVVAPIGMAEADGVRAQVHGFCPAIGCREGIELPGAFTSLSDHCPVAVDLLDRDLDRSQAVGAQLARRSAPDDRTGASP